MALIARADRHEQRPADAPAVIGPNAVIQLLQAMKAAGRDDFAVRVFTNAGVRAWLNDPPSVMVDERRVARLHQAVRALMPPGESAPLLAEAGRLTADYLLANRIPRAARTVLSCLPPRLAAGLLVPAIRAHAWTFAGTGQFAASAGSPVIFIMTGNPLCAGERTAAPACVWQAAVFERLFQRLVSADSRAVETDCEACGDGFCRFVVGWKRMPR
jgi:divinyl protochlorophyllide a 8-vinyl-reductase